jgi:hypothetical protein
MVTVMVSYTIMVTVQNVLFRSITPRFVQPDRTAAFPKISLPLWFSRSDKTKAISVKFIEAIFIPPVNFKPSDYPVNPSILQTTPASNSLQ